MKRWPITRFATKPSRYSDASVISSATMKTSHSVLRAAAAFGAISDSAPIMAPTSGAPMPASMPSTNLNTSQVTHSGMKVSRPVSR